ncbi:hypothetical protein HMPREF1987_01892 [Peptostreptococcaceae bacterium oral taxon 113 str. W5053]|nr:hypothetical protein HMPREF1987_01892 [Peptostreptococcaceae bacterium oral taxon 113 str. W5053]
MFISKHKNPSLSYIHCNIRRGIHRIKIENISFKLHKARLGAIRRALYMDLRGRMTEKTSERVQRKEL